MMKSLESPAGAIEQITDALRDWAAAGEDRLHLRPIEKWILPAIGLVGVPLSPGTITGEAGTTWDFSGLAAASILPTISLLVTV